MAGLLPGLLAGCYTYRVLPTNPAPQTRVTMQLSDVGRVGSATTIGAETQSLDGRVIATNDTAYRLAVSSVKPLRGPRVRWTGEEVTLRRDYVAIAQERRLHKGRTALFSVAVAFAAITTMVYFDILGFGSLDIPFIPGADGDADQ